MLKNFFPHRWIGLKAIEILGLVLFYATLAVGIYALGCLIYSFFVTPENLTYSRKLYGSAAIQAGIACLAELTIVKLCHALRVSEQSVSKN